jgi:hypothetical protein
MLLDLLTTDMFYVKETFPILSNSSEAGVRQEW